MTTCFGAMEISRSIASRVEPWPMALLDACIAMRVNARCFAFTTSSPRCPVPGGGYQVNGHSAARSRSASADPDVLTHCSLPTALPTSQAEPASVAAETRSGVFGLPVLDCAGVGRWAPALSAPAGGDVAQPANPSSTFLCRDNFGHHSAQQVTQGLLLGG